MWSALLDVTLLIFSKSEFVVNKKNIRGLDHNCKNIKLMQQVRITGETVMLNNVNLFIPEQGVIFFHLWYSFSFYFLMIADSISHAQEMYRVFEPS